MNIDWNCEEAKGKDYCFINNLSCAMVFQKYAIAPKGAYFWTLHERPKAEQMKETFYTKEMHERGETVGSEMTAIYKDKEVLIRLGCDTLRNVVFRLDGEWVTVNVDYIKPIDTRTDKEKAIDSVAKTIALNGMNKHALAQVIINGLEEDKIITFTGDK